MICSKCRTGFDQRTKPGSPEITRLLRSQCALTPAHKTQVSRFLLDAEADLNDIETQISALRSMTTFLNAKRQVIKKETERFRSCLAPVRRLPTEILDYIFVLSAELNTFEEQHWRFRALGASLVCKRWRDVALACPQLWSTLRVYVDWNSPMYLETFAATKLCLGRSAQASLDLDICISPFPQHEIMSPLLESLIQQSRRWRNVRMECNDVAYVSNSLSRAEFPNLERIELDSMNMSLPPLRPAVFQPLPKLSSLCLKHSARPEDNIGFPWSQIRALHLEIDSSSHDLYELPPICSGVDHLHYTLNTDLIMSIPSQKSTTVRSLSIEASGLDRNEYCNVMLLLRTLELPLVRSVSLRSRFTNGNMNITNMLWPHDAFLSLFTRSVCSITNLDLVDIPVDTEQLTSVLRLTPALESLTVCQTISTRNPHELTGSNLDMGFVQRLHSYAASSFSSNSQPLVPKLASLTFHATEDWFDDGALFVNVVQSRWIPERASSSDLGVDCLRSVELYLLDGELDEDVYEPLRTLEKAGLKLWLRGME